MSEERFKVWLFLADGTHLLEAADLGAKAAVLLAKNITLRPAAILGIIERVVIADDGDFTVFEWTNDSGVTFPPICEKNERTN